MDGMDMLAGKLKQIGVCTFKINGNMLEPIKKSCMVVFAGKDGDTSNNFTVRAYGDEECYQSVNKILVGEHSFKD